ncbi:MAG: hypothetical protein Q8P21_02025 [bacterium]|nr:hypothetical protein [bacterium]
MTEQVIFKIDKKLKEQAMKKAKREGIAFSSVLKSATQAYIEDQFEVGLVYNPKLIRRILKVGKEPTVRGDLRKLLKRY